MTQSHEFVFFKIDIVLFVHIYIYIVGKKSNLELYIRTIERIEASENNVIVT